MIPNTFHTTPRDSKVVCRRTCPYYRLLSAPAATDLFRLDVLVRHGHTSNAYERKMLQNIADKLEKVVDDVSLAIISFHFAADRSFTDSNVRQAARRDGRRHLYGTTDGANDPPLSPRTSTV